jgi:hypothetical protein
MFANELSAASSVGAYRQSEDRLVTLAYEGATR